MKFFMLKDIEKSEFTKINGNKKLFISTSQVRSNE